MLIAAPLIFAVWSWSTVFAVFPCRDGYEQTPPEHPELAPKGGSLRQPAVLTDLVHACESETTPANYDMSCYDHTCSADCILCCVRVTCIVYCVLCKYRTLWATLCFTHHEVMTSVCSFRANRLVAVILLAYLRDICVDLSCVGCM